MGLSRIFCSFLLLKLSNSRHQILHGKERQVLGALYDERILNQYTRHVEA